MYFIIECGYNFMFCRDLHPGNVLLTQSGMCMCLWLWLCLCLCCYKCKLSLVVWVCIYMYVTLIIIFNCVYVYVHYRWCSTYILWQMGLRSTSSKEWSSWEIICSSRYVSVCVCVCLSVCLCTYLKQILIELLGLEIATPAADWWSLGAIMFELLTGKVTWLSTLYIRTWYKVSFFLAACGLSSRRC